ncbi:MAG: beta-carotene hydroxylase [Anaerolineae bacterium]|nr:beta-carotene hydroxylase [Anaerolineae bacterium]
MLVNILIFLGTAVFMEFVAWATHKYVMHGFLWVLHEDHHQPSGRGLQKNDLFAVFFASISFIMIYHGVMNGHPRIAAAGFGVALYGFGYFMFHDIMFHKRVRFIRYKPGTNYEKRIIRAHRIHHRHPGQKDSTSFGFLYAPKKYDNPDL